MTTQFEIDCALMAGLAYQSSRDTINWFPAPFDWVEFSHVPNDTYPTTLSFEASAFQNTATGEIVISYAGTAHLTDWISNLTLGTGFSSSQLEQAALYYLQIKAANPTATISFTGHSLGGGLAALLGSSTILTQGGTGLDILGIDLHSQALLSAFLLNDDFRTITFKLPELLKMVFDSALYARDTDTDKKNFIDQLIRHQIGNAAGVVTGDAMLDRFTADLWKIAQDGGFTLTNAHIANTLVAFAMQMYYENPEAANPDKTLFTDVTGGIRFDRTDVAANLNDAKGWQMYFQNYLNTLTLEEHRIVLQLLPAATDWFIQAGSVSMSATADVSKAFMVGGIGADHEWRFVA